METIAEFNDNHGFNVKLTNEKIFIDATGSSETIALRGLTGVGLYDDLEKYNKELEEWKTAADKNTKGKWACWVLGGLAFISSISNGEEEGMIFGAILFVAGYVISKKQVEKPILNSFFKLMITGRSREFPFHKSDETSVKIADFINKIEDTLTAYK